MQHEFFKSMQLRNPEDPQTSSWILENVNLNFMKAADIFFPKLDETEKRPCIDNKCAVKNAAAKMRRLRQKFLNVKTVDARNRFSYLSKKVTNLIIHKKPSK